MTKTRRVIVKDESGKTKVHERVVFPLSETFDGFMNRVYGKRRKLIVSTEKDRIGEFCRPYTYFTRFR